MRKTLLTLLVSAALAAGCKSASQDGVITELAPNQLRAQWTRTLTLKGSEPRDMYVIGDGLFIYTTKNVLYKMDRHSGDVVFVADVAGPDAKVKAPAVLDDQIIVPTDFTLEYLDPRGFRKQTIRLPDPMRSGIAVSSSGVYVGVDSARGGARIARIDSSHPNSPYRWELMARGVVVATPVVYEGAVYAASHDGGVYALDVERNPAWSLPSRVFWTAGPIHGDVAAEASGVYVASADSKLYCLDRNTGKVQWQYYAGVPLYDSPAVTATSVYILVRDRGMAAIDKSTGAFNRAAKWVVPDTTMFLAENDELVFLRGKRNAIVAVEKATGQVRFRSERGDLVAFAVNTVDGTVYAATEEGKIVAAVAVKRHGEMGELVWAEPSQVPALN